MGFEGGHAKKIWLQRGGPAEKNVVCKGGVTKKNAFKFSSDSF